VVAQDAFEALGLDRLVWMPARQAPNRAEPKASPEQRLRMLRSAVAGDPRFEVSDMEIRREGTSFTVDTVRALRTENPGDDLYVLIGADQWAGFATWREPDEIGRLARIAVMARAGARPGEAGPEFASQAGTAPVEGPTPAGGRPHVEVSVTRVDVSATLVRRRVADGLPIRYLVPEPVRQIIEAENLYLQAL
jgi:nicotinate-nucleotide adenylyltransferase